MSNDQKDNPRILIVDDVPQNIQVLANILKDAGYRMGFAKDAKTALSHIETTQFDLILLDIMMPEMDGFEVCKRLKKDKKKKDIPIIFITAKDATADKKKGFALGAVDYITKPFDAQEVLARIKTHLTIRNYTSKLEQMVEERTRQLIHADRLATLGIFSAAIVHEIKNPLSYIMGSSKLLQIFWNSAKPILEKHKDEDNSGELPKEIEKVDEKLKDISFGCDHISRLLNSLKAYSRPGYGQIDKFPIVDIINNALNLISYKLEFTDIILDIDLQKGLMIRCDPQKISQVFINLIDNSCDAITGRKSGRIKISAISKDNEVVISIRDNGPGIPGEIADKIFSPFFTTKERDKGTGLGLFIVKTIIEEHKGKISFASVNGKGAEFKIVLPMP